MTDNLPSEFYENINWKNWTVNVIRHGLQINNELYTTIYTAIEMEMRSQNILGHKLNQSLVKKQLKLGQEATEAWSRGNWSLYWPT